MIQKEGEILQGEDFTALEKKLIIRPIDKENPNCINYNKMIQKINKTNKFYKC